MQYAEIHSITSSRPQDQRNSTTSLCLRGTSTIFEYRVNLKRHPQISEKWRYISSIVSHDAHEAKEDAGLTRVRTGAVRKQNIASKPKVLTTGP